MTGDLGFDDNYALVMRKARAQELGITKISDLKTHPELRVGPTAEFLNRKDGFKPLCQRYGLHFDDISSLEHALGYAKLRDKQIDLMECYTTDAEIAEYNLLVLDDDLHFFPRYKAVYLYRLDLPPKAIDALKQLEGKIDQPTMIRLNGEARKNDGLRRRGRRVFRQGGRAAGAERVGKRDALHPAPDRRASETCRHFAAARDSRGRSARHRGEPTGRVRRRSFWARRA